MARRHMLVVSVLIPVSVSLAGVLFEAAMSQAAIAWPTAWKLWTLTAVLLVLTVTLEFAYTRVAGGHTARTPSERPPQQMPPSPLRFVGRTSEISFLDQRLLDRPTADHGPRIALIVGPGGFGKTALASFWADRHRNRFPDGRLYIDLHGFSPSNEPIPAVAVLGAFLAALGKDPEGADVPAELLAARYRSEIAGRRLLVILDNARDDAHVRSLLPGGESCVTIVTSRNRLPELRTSVADALDLTALPDDDAQRLLRRHLGQERLGKDPQTVKQLFARCKGVPLVINILAAHIQTHPAWPLAVFLAPPSDEPSRRLLTGDLSGDLTAVIASTVAALPATAATTFRHLGAACGPDIGLVAAANLTAQSVTDTRAAMSALEEVHLVEQPEPDRYRMHDLVRLYATELQTDDIPLRRLVDFYTHTALAGARLLLPHRRTFDLEPLAPGWIRWH